VNVNGAGSVMVGPILLRLEFEVLQLILICANAVILEKSRQIWFVSLFVVKIAVSRLVLLISARGLFNFAL
jgi:hypothetical protein